ncbi:glycerate kinase [Aquipuribacter nitratireducens]|uniref:Glycerate kinase n=1 Tax=Aquipuribacter nitratireducens TaxID=650104 RepID=A0ABW0GI00_9MICO
MRVVLAPDSFKGSLDAAGVCDALERGVRDADPHADVVAVPMADGGEGTLDSLLRSWGGERVTLDVTDPLGGRVPGHYGWDAAGRRAVVELAVASGLTTRERLEPLRATTRGTGELLRDALDRGADEVVVCLGGSATTDGGTGILRALGVRLLDAAGRDLPDGGGALVDLDRVDVTALHPRAHEVRVRVACDVDSPLLGPDGAAAVFGPQKGAGPDDVAVLDAGLARLAEALVVACGPRAADVVDLPGAGAAGGTAAGLVAVLDTALEPGASLVADAAGLDAALAGADLVVTGEGRVDEQSARGKVVSAVVALAAAAGVPVVAVGGQVRGDLAGLHAAGLTAAFAVADGPRPLAELVADPAPFVRRTAEQVTRLFLARRR